MFFNSSCFFSSEERDVEADTQSVLDADFTDVRFAASVGGMSVSAVEIWSH